MYIVKGIFLICYSFFPSKYKKNMHNLQWSFLWNLLENNFKLFNNINTFTRRLKYNYISMY